MLWCYLANCDLRLSLDQMGHFHAFSPDAGHCSGIGDQMANWSLENIEKYSLTLLFSAHSPRWAIDPRPATLALLISKYQSTAFTNNLHRLLGVLLGRPGDFWLLEVQWVLLNFITQLYLFLSWRSSSAPPDYLTRCHRRVGLKTIEWGPAASEIYSLCFLNIFMDV